MLSESSQDGENHAQPIILTRRAFMSLSEIERKNMLSSVVIVKDDGQDDGVQSSRLVLLYSLVYLTLTAHAVAMTLWCQSFLPQAV